MKIDIDLIKPDPNQPRKVISQSYIQGLAESLKVEGMINPVECDGNYMIITGEQRWRAAKLAGWKEVPVNINTSVKGEYERFRRQMAENLHQSSASTSTPMNAIDVARGYKKLLEMKGHFVAAPKLQGKNKGISDLAKDLGVSEKKIRTYLSKLFEPDYVLEAIIKDSSKFTAFDEANRLPEEYRDKVKKAIAKEEITGRNAVRRFSQLAKSKPEKAEIELARIMGEQSFDANRVLNRCIELQIVLKNATPEKWSTSDLTVVKSQLGSTTGAIRKFAGRINKTVNSHIMN
jgi:ParB family chromosome partitioning protein